MNNHSLKIKEKYDAANIAAKFKQKVAEEGLLLVKFSGKALNEKMMGEIAELKTQSQNPRIRTRNIVLVHGGGPQITREMEKRGMKVGWRDGNRITDWDAMRVVELEMRKVNCEITDELMKRGFPVAPLVYGIFRGESMGMEYGGRYGRITHVETAEVMRAIAEGSIPVLAPIGNDFSGNGLNMNADECAVKAAMALNAKEVVMVSYGVDVMRVNGRKFPEIAGAQLEAFRNDGAFANGMIPKADACILAANAGISVRIVNGDHEGCLAKALNGTNGTLVKP